MNRECTLSELSDQVYDLLVVGGGITGAGVAREASLRGLRVALVERLDFAIGTSSRSTKLIHGGLRYLKNFEFRLVREAVQERMRLIKMAPHLARVVPFIFPVYRGDADTLWKLRAGLTLYDWFAGSDNPIPHRIRNKEDLLEQEPMLNPAELIGGAVYCDAATDDGRLTFETIQSAVRHGAMAANYAEVQSFLYDGSGLAIGARVVDRLSGDVIEIRAGRILVAAGPWADDVQRLDDPGAAPLLRLTKGVHLTLPANRLPIKHAVVMHGRDGRIMFAVPAGEWSYLGTTDTDYQGDPAAVGTDWSDVDYVLDAARRAFPESKVTPEDVVANWAGLRPLLRPKGDVNPSATSRDYALHHTRSGLVFVAGGKLTAFRTMSSHVVDHLFPKTKDPKHQALSMAPLPGAVGPALEVTEVERLAASTSTSKEEVARLANHYGTAFRSVAAELPPVETWSGPAEFTWLRAQMRHTVRSEMAVRLDDVLYRRTSMMLFSKHNGRPYVDTLAAEMGQLLGWSAGRVQEERSRCHAEIDAIHAWRQQATRVTA